jgi:hypothetical protein
MNTICYTGIGARKSGKHTVAQYLKVMDKTSLKDCPVYFKSLQCKSCKKKRELNNKLTKKYIKNKSYKMSKKTTKQLAELYLTCEKCKNKKTKKTKKCNLKKYIEYSGAVPGLCSKIA